MPADEFTTRMQFRAAAAIVVAILAAGGCSVRDERAVGTGDAAWWTTTSEEVRPGLIGGSPAQPPAAAAIEYEEGFAAAARRAAETGKPTLLVFRAAWCRWSGDLLSAAAGDPRIVTRARRCVCVAVDADRDPDTCAVRGAGLPDRDPARRRRRGGVSPHRFLRGRAAGRGARRRPRHDGHGPPDGGGRVGDTAVRTGRLP